MEKFSFNNKKIIITGAGSGIGLKTVELLLDENVNLIAIDKNIDNLEKYKDYKNLKCIKANITIKEDRKKILESIENTIDGLVNSAGIIELLPMRFVGEKQFNNLIENNLLGPTLLTNSLIKKAKIKEGGSIVFLSSIISNISTQTNGLYAATKAAISALAKTYALELAPQKIRVNAILPGFVNTPMVDYISQFYDINEAEKKHPLGIGEALDVANSICFLLSNEAKWITGSNLVIDGGYSSQ